MKRKTLFSILTIFLVASLVGTYASLTYYHNIDLNGSAGLNVGTGNQDTTPKYKVDATILFEKETPAGQIQTVGSWTKLGLNCTFGKITGLASAYNMTQYTYNITSMSIGNAGTLNTDSTVLPGEWNRTAITAHDAAYNTCNFTAVFHPDAGPYTADCFGLNIGPVTIGLPYTLIAYDTFTEVTGIDSTFTITGEFRIYSTSA